MNKWNSLSRNMKKPYPGLREDFNRLWILHSDASDTSSCITLVILYLKTINPYYLQLKKKESVKIYIDNIQINKKCS